MRGWLHGQLVGIHDQLVSIRVPSVCEGLLQGLSRKRAVRRLPPGSLHAIAGIHCPDGLHAMPCGFVCRLGFGPLEPSGRPC